MNRYPLVYGILALIICALALLLFKRPLPDEAGAAASGTQMLMIFFIVLGFSLMLLWRQWLPLSKDTGLVWTHLVSMLIALAMLVFLLIPSSDPQSVDKLTDGLGWIFSATILMIGSLVVLAVLGVRCYMSRK